MITTEAVEAYAILAVRDEMMRPLHGKRVGYDRQAAMDDVLNHFSELRIADEHWVREAVADAEQKLGVTP